MGRDRLIDQIARAMARAENASEDHFEAYRHVAEAVAAVVEPLLAEKDKAAVEVVERLLRATQDDPDAGDLHLARHKAREFLAGRAVSGVGSTGFVPCSHCDGHGLMQTGYTGTLQYCGECNACDGSGTVPVVTDEERVGLRSACSKCGGLVRLELRCEACGDLPAVEGAESWTEWRAMGRDNDGPYSGDVHVGNWHRSRERTIRQLSGLRAAWQEVWVEQRTVCTSRPVRVEEQGED